MRIVYTLSYLVCVDADPDTITGDEHQDNSDQKHPHLQKARKRCLMMIKSHHYALKQFS